MDSSFISFIYLLFSIYLFILELILNFYELNIKIRHILHNITIHIIRAYLLYISPSKLLFIGFLCFL